MSRASRRVRGHLGARETHSLVYRRDKWTCRMEECLCPEGRAIDPALRGTDGPWSPSIDHIVPLSFNGDDDPRNMRAAHKRCNGGDVMMQHPRQVVPEPLRAEIVIRKASA